MSINRLVVRYWRLVIGYCGLLVEDSSVLAIVQWVIEYQARDSQCGEIARERSEKIREFSGNCAIPNKIHFCIYMESSCVERQNGFSSGWKAIRTFNMNRLLEEPAGETMWCCAEA